MKFDSAFDCASHYLRSEAIESFDEGEDWVSYDGPGGYVNVVKGEFGWEIDWLGSNFEESDPEWSEGSHKWQV